MKKQLIIIGITFLLIVVGFSVRNDIGLTNIGDLQANPEKYLGLKVKVKGTVGANMMVMDDGGHYFLISSKTLLTGKYYLTGIVEQNAEGYYLDILEVVAV